MSFKAPGNTPPGLEPDINLGLRLPHRTARRLLPANVSQTTGPACRGGEIKGPRPRFRAAIQGQVMGRHRKSSGRPRWEDVLFPALG